MLGFSVGVISLLVVSFTTVRTMDGLRDSQSKIQEIQPSNVIDYLALDASLSRNRVVLQRMLRSQDPGERQADQQEIASASLVNNANTIGVAGALYQPFELAQVSEEYCRVLAG